MTDALALPESELLLQLAFDKAQDPDFVAKVERERLREKSQQMTSEGRLAQFQEFFKKKGN